MPASFQADPAFESGSIPICDGPLSQIRLQDDARFPWLILIPRLPGLRELEDLSSDDRATLMDEVVRAGQAVRRLGEAADRPVHKLNVGAIGNVTAQLHVHVVGRRPDDGLWPDPVWGRGPPRPYAPDELHAAEARIRLQFGGATPK